jgi:hypothetical protein
MNRLLIIFSSFIFLIACQDEDFKTPDYNQKIVVDGWIEQGQPAKVFLTFSAAYFSDVDSVSLRKLVLTRAKVTVIDGINEEILTLRTNHDYFPPYIYESNYLVGKVGHTYKLKIEFDGKIVTSITQIPEPQKLDSMWFVKAPGIDTSGYIMLKFKDNPGVDNFYRILTKTGTKTMKYVPAYLPNLDGRLVDGQTVTLSVTSVKNSALMSKKMLYFSLNDTVNIKFCTVEQPVYNFWFSIQEESLNTENPFAATNSHVLSNIDGGLGIWAGYGANTYRIVCK